MSSKNPPALRLRLRLREVEVDVAVERFLRAVQDLAGFYADGGIPGALTPEASRSTLD
jgi:hypothetical protein